MVKRSVIVPQKFYMIEELVAHVMSGVKTGKESFFFNVGYEASTMAIQVAVYLAMKHKEINRDANILTFRDIMDITGKAGLEELVKQMACVVTDDEYGLCLLNDLKKISESPPDYYSKISSSLRVALMELTQGNIGQIIGSAKGNKVIERLENNITGIHCCVIFHEIKTVLASFQPQYYQLDVPKIVGLYEDIQP